MRALKYRCHDLEERMGEARDAWGRYANALLRCEACHFFTKGGVCASKLTGAVSPAALPRCFTATGPLF